MSNNLFLIFVFSEVCQTISVMMPPKSPVVSDSDDSDSGIEEDQNHCQIIETIITENRVQTLKTCKTMRTNLIRLA